MKIECYQIPWKSIRDLVWVSSLASILAVSVAACSGGGNGDGGTETISGNPPPVSDSGSNGNGSDTASGGDDDDVSLPGNPEPLPDSPSGGSTVPGDGGNSSGSDTDNGDGNTGGDHSDPVTPVRLVVRPQQVRVALDGRAPLTAIAYDRNGRIIFPSRVQPLTLGWTSDDNSVAGVDPLGWVSGIRTGRTTIRAQMRVNGTPLTADVGVTVDPELAIQLMELNPARVQFAVGAVRTVKILAYNTQLQLFAPPCLSAATVQIDPPYLTASLTVEGGAPRLELAAMQTGTSWVTFECGGLVTAPLVVDIGAPSQPAPPTEFSESNGGFNPDLVATDAGLALVAQDMKHQVSIGYVETGGQWISTVLPEFFTGPTPARLVADPAAGRYGWLCAARDGQLACRHAQADGTWVIRTVAPVTQSDSTRALAFDAAAGPNGILWVVFQAAPGRVAIARAEETARETWIVTPILYADMDAVALAFAPDQQPRVLVHVTDSVYYGAPSGPGHWQFERIDAASTPALALSVGNDGRAHAVYQRGDQVMYAEQQGGGWQTSLLGAVSTGALTKLGLRLDGNNTARVTLSDSHSQQLRVMTRRFPALLNTSLAWRTESPFADQRAGPDHVALFDARDQWLLGYRDIATARLAFYREPLLPFYAAEPDSSNIGAAAVSAPVTIMPALVQAQGGNRLVTLDWGAVPTAMHYNIYWGQAGGITFGRTQVSGVEVPHFEHAGRNNGETYYYAVTAVGPFGESALSMEVAATPQLGAPIHLRVRADTGHNSLTWDPVAGVSEYRVYWNTTGAPGAFDASFAVDGNATQFVHSAVTPNTTYYYAIQAADEYSTSPISADIATLPPPRHLAADGIYQDGSLELTWETVTGAQSYTLYYSTSPGVSRDTAARLAGVKPPFSHQELGHQIKYYYRVAATNQDGESALSEETSAISIINDTPFTWQRISALPTPRHLLTAVTANGSVYAVGGSDGLTTLDTLDVYNPTLDQWEKIDTLPHARREHGSAVINGKLYVFGGWIDQATTREMDVYDLTTRIWSTAASMPTARSNFATAVVGNAIFAIGGWNGEELAAVERYDVMTNQWSVLTDLPLARSHLATAVVGERIIALGGRLRGQAVNNVDLFDVTLGTWQKLADLPTARSQLAGAVLNGRVYAIGGWNGLAPVNTVDIYDPRHDSWSLGTTLPTARNSLSSTVLNNKIYTLGGWNGTRHVSTVEVLGAQ